MANRPDPGLRLTLRAHFEWQWLAAQAGEHNRATTDATCRMGSVVSATDYRMRPQPRSSKGAGR